MKKEKVFVVIGGKWFDKVNGNTYHSAKVIDTQTDNTYFTDFVYGYGSSYLYSAREFISDTLKCDGARIIDGGSFYLNKKDVKQRNF